MEKEHVEIPIHDRYYDLRAQERVEFVRGLIPDFSTRISKEIDVKLENIKNLDEKTRDRILSAFQSKVEAYIARANHGGSALDHLSQIGVMIVTYDEQMDLDASAAAMAGEILSEVGLDEVAQLSYADAGERIAKKLLSSPLNASETQ